ncbi:MAG: hypothetical protein IM533_15410, partial [Pseudanabaena sp. M007S1SP1A06QC]|nr:hypothetical protein [Pseudanabaena sp. M007S1SP1A06QC]
RCIGHIDWQGCWLEGDRSFPSLLGSLASSHLKNLQTKIAFPANWKSLSLPRCSRLVVIGLYQAAQVRLIVVNPYIAIYRPFQSYRRSRSQSAINCDRLSSNKDGQ